MESQLIETWEIHDRINRYLLDSISDDTVNASIGPKHRSIYKLFAHIHNVRLMWLQASAPELMKGLTKLEKDEGRKAELAKALESSGEAICKRIKNACAAGGKVKNFKPHVVAFVGYLISHESHHRGQIGWTLKTTGHPMDKKIAFGLWEWGVR